MNPNVSNGVGIGYGYYGGTPGNTTQLAYTPVTDENVLLNSGDPIAVQITYIPANASTAASLNLSFTDTVTTGSVPFTLNFNTDADLTAFTGGANVLVGFSGSTGSGTATQQISGFTYSVPGAGAVVLNNPVILTGGTTSGIVIGTAGATAAVTMGALSVTSGAATTLNLSASSDYAANIPYSLTLGAAALGADITFNVANNTNGGGNSLGSLTLGAINYGGQTRSITLSGGGTLVLGAAATGPAVGSQFNITAGSLNADAANALGVGATGTGAKVTISKGAIFNVDTNQVIQSLASAAAGAGTVTLNGATLTVGGGFGSTFSGLIQDGAAPGALMKVGGDTLTLGSSSNPYSGGTTIAAGTVVSTPAAFAGAPPFGSGAVNLAGGKLVLQGQYTGSVASGLTGKYYLGTPSDTYIDNVADINSHFGPLTPKVTAASTAGGYTTFNFGTYAIVGGQYQGDFGPNSGDAADFGGSGATIASNFSIVWTGQFNVTKAGTYSFGMFSDDGAAMYIDPNNDGQYVQVANNLGAHAPQQANGSVALSPGLHNVVLAYYQGTGGYYLSTQVATNGDPAVMATDIPDANNLSQMGFITATSTTTLAASQSYANNVVVSGNSMIDVSGSLAATLGTLAIGGNALSLTSADATTSPYSLTLGTTTLSGNATFSVANSAGGGLGSLSLGAIGDGGGKFGITKTGAGTLFLTAAGTYGGGTTIDGGIVNIGADADLGNSPAPVSVSITFGGNGTLQFAAGFGLVAGRNIAINAGDSGTFDTQANKVTIGGLVSLANSTSPNSSVLVKQGTGTLEIDGFRSLGNNSSLQASAGVLRLNLVPGSSTVGTGVKATVAAGATLELAGLAASLNQSVNITNNSAAATTGGLYISGTNQVVGTIAGSGSTVVGSASTPGSLTAYQIVQNSLTIHGTGTTAATAGSVTLVPSGSGSTTNPTGPNNVNFSSTLTSLTIDNNGAPLGSRVYFGTLDIGNNGLVVAYGSGVDPYSNLDDMVRSAFDSAHWDGTGITSSLALAAANSHTPLNIGLMDFTPGQNGDGTFIVFEGQTITTNAVLMRLTYMDDINSFGDMTIQDAAGDALLFAANYGVGTTWAVGDITHDGAISSADALLFAANYATGLPSLDGTTGNAASLQNGLAAVPEPASALLAICGALGCGAIARMTLPRRRR